MARDRYQLLNGLSEVRTYLSWGLAPHASRAWEGKRSELSNIATVYDFCLYMRDTFGDVPVASLQQAHIDGYLEFYRERGLSASSLNTRASVIASCLKSLNRTDLKAIFVGRPAKQQWAMDDDELKAIIQALANPVMAKDMGFSTDDDGAYLMRAYIILTVETGLRVEEVLRLVPEDFDLRDGMRPVLYVPGTKNAQSAMRIAISARASRWASSLIAEVNKRAPGSPRRLFDVPYRKLWDWWDACRAYLYLADEPTATLKGLRRTFAARCLRKGLPVEMIRELMRHASLETTLRYLRTFGLSDNDETRALLNKQLGSDVMSVWEQGQITYAEDVPVRGVEPPPWGYDENGRLLTDATDFSGIELRMLTHYAQEARGIVSAAERDLGPLSDGARRDLLKDQRPDWPSALCDYLAVIL